MALVVGYPALRLSYHSFAIVTLAFTLIVRIVWINWVSLTNGPMGIPGVPRPRLSLPFLGPVRHRDGHRLLLLRPGPGGR